ncbi:MAG: hypothetical protein QOH90_950 [Actinomycetota bacterium]|nr:hypothetical protein [Actinomycetota bacterium]
MGDAQRGDPLYLGVVGAGDENEETDAVAFEVGAGIAKAGEILICGGLGGVMTAAARGARAAGGRTVGILPGDSRAHGNSYLDVAIPTGMGEMRNALIARAADVLIAVGGEYGTLSEIAFALKIGKPVVGLHSWSAIDGILQTESAEEAVATALRLAGSGYERRPGR